MDDGRGAQQGSCPVYRAFELPVRGQNLGAEDYQAEQTYHMDRQRSHSRWLHAAGICEGRTVTFDKDNSRLTVSPGTAVDGQGWQIVLAEGRHKEDLPDQGTVRVYVSYNEEQSDQAGAGENEGHNMRWHEWPVIEVVEAGGTPEGTDPILLAEVDIDEGQVDHSVRRYAGLRLPGGETGDQAVTLRATAPGQAELKGDLAVTGNVGIGTTEPQSPLSVSGGATIGADYATKTAPANGLIVQGDVGIGTASPEATLDIRGTLKANVMMAGLMFRGEEKNYVEIPEMNPDYANGFTVEAWVRYRSLQHWSRIIDFGNGAGKDNIFLANRETTTDLWFEVHRDGEKLAVWAAGALETGTWMHLAATVDGSDQAALYQNGQLLVSGKIKAPTSEERKKNFIGRSNWKDDACFDGKIAEVAIWNRARTEAEINHDMNKKLSGSEDGLVGYWPCDEGAGKQVKDKAREQHHGTIHGATWFQEDIPAITIGEYGNVGIGTAEPWALLHVAGDVMFDGRIGPHYDSDWIEVPSGAGQEIPLTHNLGVYPGLIQILTKSNHKNDGSALKAHYPNAIKVSQINSDSYEQRCAAGFGVRAITETEIILVRCGHIWHGQTNQEYFNEGWIRVFMWKFGVGVPNMPS